MKLLMVLITVGFCGIGISCNPPTSDPEPLELEEEEITLSRESRIDPDQDQKAVVYEGEEGGMMPGTFPADFPLLESGTVIDFGEEEGVLFAVSRVQLSVDTVRERFRRMAGARGWIELSNEDLAVVDYEKDGRRVQLLFSDSSPGTDVRFRWW